MKRFLILSELHSKNFGSIEEFDILIAAELRKRGHITYFGFSADPDHPEIRKMIEDAGGVIAETLYTFVNGKKRPLIARMLALFKFISNNNIDLIHINFFSLTNPYLLAAYFSGATIVFTDHTSLKVPNRNFLKSLISQLIHIPLKWRISKYVGITGFVRDRMENTHHIQPPKSVTIYNGINFDRFKPVDRSEARRQIGLPVGGRIIVSVATLIPEKGLQHLIEAAALLINAGRYDDLKIIIAGDGYYRQYLEGLAEKLGITENILFLGNRNDVNFIVAASDIVVVPSVWHEGFGLIIAEAMAARRPVVASKIGGIPELIEHEVNGLLASPGDELTLAKSIARLLDNPDFALQLADNAVKKCHEKFNLSEKVVEYAELYEGVL